MCHPYTGECVGGFRRLAWSLATRADIVSSSPFGANKRRMMAMVQPGDSWAAKWQGCSTFEWLMATKKTVDGRRRTKRYHLMRDTPITTQPLRTNLQRASSRGYMR